MAHCNIIFRIQFWTKVIVFAAKTKMLLQKAIKATTRAPSLFSMYAMAAETEDWTFAQKHLKTQK